MMTGHPGIFAGGDMVPAERTVTVGIGHGKQAARHIDGWLRGEPYEPPGRPSSRPSSKLNAWYYADAPRTVRPQLDAARRASTFDEVVAGLDEDERRCSRLAAACRAATASAATTATASAPTTRCSRSAGADDGYAIDLDYCKGCGICVAECPCGAIVMVPEEG